MRVFVVANDVVPEMGGPVAAPGLRAAGLAEGLRAHGHEVTLEVVGSMEAKRGRVIAPQNLASVIRETAPDLVIVSNDLHLDAIPDDVPLVFDVFSARDQELAARKDPPPDPANVDRIRRQMARGVTRARLVIVNGPAKLGYVDDLVPGAAAKSISVPIGIPIEASHAVHEPPFIVGIAGYLQRWSQPGPGLDALLSIVDGHPMRVEVVTGTHWGSTVDVPPSSPLRRLLDHPSVAPFSPMPFAGLRARMQRWHVVWDVFDDSPERRLAMVTRSVVALASGVPVIHPPNSEVAPFIEAFDAGWLVAPGDDAGILSALGGVLHRSARARKQSGAAQLGREVFSPTASVEPLVEALRRW